MGFFYNDQRDAKPKRQAAPAKARLEDIPVHTLREMSCSVCPRDKDPSMRTPKMRPEGPARAPVYLLGGSPSEEDDEDEGWPPFGPTAGDDPPPSNGPPNIVLFPSPAATSPVLDPGGASRGEPGAQGALRAGVAPALGSRAPWLDHFSSSPGLPTPSAEDGPSPNAGPALDGRERTSWEW